MYVSPSGDGGDDCSEELPCTIEQVFDVLALRRNQHRHVTVVTLDCGVYAVSKPLVRSD